MGPAGIVAVEPEAKTLAVDAYPLVGGQATLIVELVAPDGTSTPFATLSREVAAGIVARFAPLGQGSAAGAGWIRGTLRVVTPKG
jgi:hypothetical protein